MMWHKQLFILALFGAAIDTSIAARAPKRPTKYVIAIFGDSLSDTGNTFRAAGAPDAALYYKGRFTNGPNWVDYLKQAVKPVQVLNYAYGGGIACADPFIEVTYPFVKNLTGQVAEFAADVNSGKVPTGKHVKLVVLQFIGSNDILNVMTRALKQGSLPTQAELGAAVQATIACRVAGIRALFSIPAVKHVVVMPMTPMHNAPVVPAPFRQQLKALEFAVGEATVATINTLQTALSAAPPGYPGAGVKLYSLGNSSDWIAAGFTEVQPPFMFLNASCFQTSASALAPLPAGLNIKMCEHPDDYAFFDGLHPTTRYHQWFASQGVLPRLREQKLIPDSF